MSSDHIQRQMDFIVEQQAKFEVAIAKPEDNLAKLADETRAHTSNIAKLGDVLLSRANYNEEQDERIAAHDKQIAALIEHGKETDRRFRETDERINILIKVVERFYDGNGK